MVRLPGWVGWLQPSWPGKRAGLLPCNHIIFFKDFIIVSRLACLASWPGSRVSSSHEIRALLSVTL